MLTKITYTKTKLYNAHIYKMIVDNDFFNCLKTKFHVETQKLGFIVSSPCKVLVGVKISHLIKLHCTHALF